MPSSPSRWPDAAGYEIYVPSCHDADGDGWGDLRGVAEKLPHHDVADYLAVNPDLGTEAGLVVAAPSTATSTTGATRPRTAARRTTGRIRASPTRWTPCCATGSTAAARGSGSTSPTRWPSTPTCSTTRAWTRRLPRPVVAPARSSASRTPTWTALVVANLGPDAASPALPGGPWTVAFATDPAAGPDRLPGESAAVLVRVA